MDNTTNDALRKALDKALEGLRYYAEGSHFTLHDSSAWDTVSGEPANFYEDDSCTATVEDGSVANLYIGEVEALAAQAAQTVPEWISVEDRMPEKGPYLVASNWGVRLAHKHDPAWADCFQDLATHSDEGMGYPEQQGVFRVTHWMPLPLPPQEPTK